MALSEDKIKGYIKRLLLSRMRILCNHGFYGLLLMHMIYAVSEEVETACTDGVRITFGTDFLESLTDAELDFVMMHEILHVVLQHCIRGDVEDPESYNIAADIVVNSNIMLENGGKASSITLSKYGTSMHIAPDGKEGHKYTAEQVYAMLPKNPNKKGKDKSTGSADGRAKKEIAKDNVIKVLDYFSKTLRIQDSAVVVLSEEKAKDLAARFIKNFAKYTNNEAGKALVAAGPQL